MQFVPRSPSKRVIRDDIASIGDFARYVVDSLPSGDLRVIGPDFFEIGACLGRPDDRSLTLRHATGVAGQSAPDRPRKAPPPRQSPVRAPLSWHEYSRSSDGKGLNKLAAAGVIRLAKAPPASRRPILAAREVHFEIDFAWVRVIGTDHLPSYRVGLNFFTASDS